ncbi:MAG: PH domain-containing protein [Chloroflexales bacterium]
MATEHKHHERLSLLEGEEILHTIQHHWLAGVTTLAIPVGVLLIATGLYSYNAVGGGFTFVYTGPRFAPDLIDWLDGALVAFIAALWALLGMVDHEGHHGHQGAKGQQRDRWWLLTMALVVIGLIAFHASGGQLYVIDPAQAAPFHPFNLLLLLIILVTGVNILYLIIELLEETLYLTNRRVIYYNGATLIPHLIEKQVQKDLMLEDVQNVLSRTETYLQHWLNYGNITVQAANAGPPISFRAANEAKEMQQRIMSARRTMLQQQTDYSYTTLINTRVYGDNVAAPPRSYPYAVTQIPSFMRWLLHDNPRIDAAQGTIIWYPHWIVMVQMLLWPLITTGTVMVLLLIVAALNLALSGLLMLVGVLALIVCGLWIAYQIEDYRNDRYVLMTTTLVDINKRPFGPEKRRAAGLGTIQTVNYKTTFLSALLGYGDVIAQTAGQGGAFTFFNVPRPRDVAAVINQYISLYRKGERDRSLDEALVLLRQFHADQQQRGELK